MKSPQEIRRHRDDILVAMKLPCDCDSTGHGEECHRGLLMMEAVQSTLSWALGENPQLQKMVDRMRADVKQYLTDADRCLTSSWTCSRFKCIRPGLPSTLSTPSQIPHVG